VTDDPQRPGWLPKARLPFDPTLSPGGGKGGQAAVLVIYAVAFVMMAGAAAFMLVRRGHAFTEPHVLIPALGAVWFLVRIIMVARPRMR
jgi:hypothetical protein